MKAWLLLALVAVAGCSTARKGPPPPVVFAGADVQRTIDAELPRAFDGLRVGAARCPDRLDPHPGTVRCVADPARGALVALVVTVSDKAGNYTFEPERDS